MDFFYSASVLGYGKGRFWHKFFNFPKLPFVTKSITINPIKGRPWAVIRWGQSVYNNVRLHNVGFSEWRQHHYCSSAIVSLTGCDYEIEWMVEQLENLDIAGIELNFSCPNVTSFRNQQIPKSIHPIYLKLSHKHDPDQYDLSRVKGIRLNSVRQNCGWAGSGEIAQKNNWQFIKRFQKDGLNIAGCSFTTYDDLKYLDEYLGCTEVGIGSAILINPRLIESILG